MDSGNRGRAEEEGGSSCSIDLPSHKPFPHHPHHPYHHHQQQQQQQQHRQQGDETQRPRSSPSPPPPSSSPSPSSPAPARSSSLNAKAAEFIPKSPSPIHSIPLMMMPACHPSPGPPIPFFRPHQAPVFVHGGPPLPPPPPPPPPYMHMLPRCPVTAPPLAPPSFSPRVSPPPLPPPPFCPTHIREAYPMQPFGAACDDGVGALSIDSNAGPNSNANSKHALTDELKATIVKQVEYYFSDSSLLTDEYLLKFVRKDPEGFVPISIVASLKNVKMLTKNYFLLASALRNSAQLVVSDDGKKVRRLHPLPEVDLEEVQSRTVVAENLPPDHSIAELEKLFGTVGNVKTVRICEPEAADGTSQTAARFSKTDIVVSNKLHALVEYGSVEIAEKAVSELTDSGNWRSGLNVRLLLRRTFHNKHGHQQPFAVKGRRSSVGGGDDSGGEDDMHAVAGGLSEKGEDEVAHGIEKAEDILGNSGYFSEKDGMKRGRGRGQGRARGRGQYQATNGRAYPIGAPYPSSNANIEMKPLPGPRMPDGTRGFTMGRGKLPTENAV